MRPTKQHSPKEPQSVGPFTKLRTRWRNSDFWQNVATLLTGTTLGQAIAFLAQIIIARLYTPAQVGVLGIITAVVGGISTVAALRYDLAIVLPEDEAKARALYKISSRANWIICGVSTVLLFVFSHQIASFSNVPEVQPHLPLAGITAWATSQVAIYGFWCNRHKKYKLMSGNRVLQSLTTAGAQVAFGFAKLGSLGLILGTFLGQGVSVGNLHRNNRKETDAGEIAPLKAAMKEYRKMPLVNGPNALVDAVRLNGIPILIGRYFGSELLGHFSKAWQLIQAPAGLINGAISQVFYQQMATTKRGDMTRVVRNGIKRSALISIAVFSLVWLLSPWAFRVVLGEQWALAGLVGRELVPWLAVNFITSPISLLFVVVKRQEVMLGHSLIYMIVPLTLLVVLRGELLFVVRVLSWTMGALLISFLLLALMVAKQYDNGHGLKDDELVQENRTD